MTRVAFLGPNGTVSDEATRYLFAGSDSEYKPCKVIHDVFASTASGETDFSVIPIENTIDGSVSLHLDLLVHEYPLPIRAEWIYPSVQNLLGLKESGDASTSSTTSYAAIKKVYSHPVAAAQCRNFLKMYLPHAEVEHISSTAKAAMLVKELVDPSIAAIGTKLAGQMYGLSLLHARVQDHDNNYTRFILAGENSLPWNESNPLQPCQQKTSVLITLPEDYAGALHQVLSAFAWRRINLSRIESRPTKKQLGSYYFYIEINESMNTVLLPAALQEIEAIGCQVRILGSYPCFQYQSHLSEV